MRSLICSRAAVAAAIVLAPLAAQAQVQPLDKVAQVPLFKDWAWRRQLSDDGVNLNVTLIAEPAVNARGYKGAGWQSAQEVDFGAVLDLKKLGWSDEGTVRVLFSDRSGRAIQQDYTGAYIQDQAYWGQGQNFRFDELSYERTFLNQRLDLKAGFYSMGNDFGGLSDVCNFNNNGACGHPLGLLYGSGWLDSPTGAWGGRLKWNDPSGWYVETGVYDISPARKKGPNGFNVDFTYTTGEIVPLEIGYVVGKTAADYPGIYKIGVYHDSSTTPDMEFPTHKVQGRNGGYVQAAQQIWKMRPGALQGISMYGVATLNDPQTGLFRTTYEAGASWRGVVPGRDDDIASLGWVQLNINPRVRAAEELAGKPVQTNEQLVELNYGVQVAPWLLVRPALQYVIRPAGYDTRPDTFVFSMHIQATL